MYAVFSTGGKQYRAATGDIIRVEKLEADKGATIELDQVLLVGEGESVNVGTPLVDGGKVTARVVEHGRGDKVKVIKFKRRKNYLKRMGHRQHYTMLEITGIEGAEQPKPAKAKKKAAPKKVEAKETAEAPKAKTAKPKAAKPKTAKPKTAKKKTAKKAEAAGSKKAAAKATAKAETKAKAPEEGDKDEA